MSSSLYGEPAVGQTFDINWERRYAENPNYRNFYPYSEVVSFLFRHAPRDKNVRASFRVLEIGCGSGNNIWFVAREGYTVSGIDGSSTAIEFARARLAREALSADLRVGDFSKLPFESEIFDLAFERAALTFTTELGARECISELRRVLKPGGVFQCGPYSDRDSSFDRSPDPDGTLKDVNVGTIRSNQARFLSLQDVRKSFADGWHIENLQHIEELDMNSPARISHCRWLASVRRI
jgi:ubiquinone/menaquinone biosynthesis C-methylase UbiE